MGVGLEAVDLNVTSTPPSNILSAYVTLATKFPGYPSSPSGEKWLIGNCRIQISKKSAFIKFKFIPESNRVAPIFNVDAPIRHVEALDSAVQVVPTFILAKSVLYVPKCKFAIRYPKGGM